MKLLNTILFLGTYERVVKEGKQKHNRKKNNKYINVQSGYI